MNFITKIRHALSHRWATKYAYDLLPPQRVREALSLEFVREDMGAFSKNEYEQNPYYASVINKQADQTIGPCPTIIASGDNPDDNDMMEDGHKEWTELNSIGKSLREFRKQAGLTGLALALRTKLVTDHPVKVGYKVYGRDALQTPWDADPESRIIDGIEYDENWVPIKFYFRNDASGTEPTPYDASEVIYWTRGYEGGRIHPVPECVSGFTVYPFIRRYLQASIEGAEFRSSFPMALELDKDVYGRNNNEGMYLTKLEKFAYQPRTVPTLPVGTTLKGLPAGATADQIDKIIRTMASACALAIDMPANLALGDSHNSNMSSAQIDVQPWKNRVNIDRIDLIPVLRTMFKDWYKRARLIRGLTPESARYQYTDMYPHMYVYDPLFQHPDPLKNANARAVDLISGVSTLNRIYSELGLNPRREINGDAKLLGRTYQEMCDLYLAARSKQSLAIIEDELDDAQTSNSEQD